MAYVASRSKILPKCLLEPFVIFTIVGKSILDERIYKDCVVFVYHRDNLANFDRVRDG